MRIWFFLLFFGIIGQRILEICIAKQNEKWITERGGYEVGKEHYKWIVTIHALLFSGIALEWVFWDIQPPRFWRYFFLLFLILQVVRAWCLRSLGRFWNTRIFILPGQVVRSGIYKYIRHPNYIVVILETFLIPFLFGAYLTAFVLPIVNALFLVNVRIPMEEEALRKETSYD